MAEEKKDIKSDTPLDKDNKTPSVEVIEGKEDSKKKKKFPWKYIINIGVVLIVTFIAVLATVFTDFNNIIDAFSHVKWEIIAICFGMEFASISCYALILYCFARLYSRRYNMAQAYACDSIGRFWSGVTPGATGGQFMQAYTYKKQGIPISAAASIMIMYSICYQIVLILYGVVALIVKVDTLKAIDVIKITISGNEISLPLIPLVIVGFCLNLGFIVLLFGMSYSKGFHHFIMGPCITLLSKMRLLKNPDKKREDLRVQVENFKVELRRLLSNIPFLLLVMVLFFLAMTFNFGIPFVTARALGAIASYTNGVDAFITSVFYSNFHQMVTGLIPIPGSAGVSEYFFWVLFKDYFQISETVNVASAGQLLWRTITFTIPLIIGGLVAAFYKSSPKEETRDRLADSRDTFIAIQHETYLEREKSCEEAYTTSSLKRSEIIAKLSGKSVEEVEDKKNSKKKDKTKKSATKKNVDLEEIIVKDEKHDDEDN